MAPRISVWVTGCTARPWADMGTQEAGWVWGQVMNSASDTSVSEAWRPPRSGPSFPAEAGETQRAVCPSSGSQVLAAPQLSCPTSLPWFQMSNGPEEVVWHL